ncbi:MAG: exosortase K [Desulfobacteraceae bacterium]|nr:exosortase K [Desulfobacteraceae bacterium]
MSSQTLFRLVKENIWFYLLVFVIAAGLKYGYSRAQSDDLNWILHPTSQVVQLLSGLVFEAELGTGFINRDKRVIIAPSCAGVNFLIIAFCMSIFSFIHRFRDLRIKMIWFGSMIVSVYGVTIGVNAARILLAIWLYEKQIQFGWMTAQRVHRMEGVAVYFIFLFLLYTLLTKIADSPGVTSFYVQKKETDQGFLAFEKYKTVKNSSFRHSLAPLFWYCLITIIVPVLNQAYIHNLNQFLEHCLMTILICSSVLFIIYLIRSGAKDRK